MLIKLILIGKLKDRSLESHCQEYLRRLGAYGKVEYTELPDSDPESEAKLILRELDKDKNAQVVVLGEEGKEYTSIELAARIPAIDRKIVFIIGGPYGVSAQIKQRADWIWSLSKMTFPHEIARLLLCEQLYRIYNLAHGGSYHHLSKEQEASGRKKSAF